VPQHCATILPRSQHSESRSPQNLSFSTRRRARSTSFSPYQSLFTSAQMYRALDPQPQSDLFKAPTEIRHAIYSYLIPERMHLIASEDGTYRITPCIFLDGDDHPNCFNRRTNDEDIYMNPRASDPIYLNRLRSSWGPHWRCHEFALQGKSENRSFGTAMSLFLVCKRM
jgi:hypothetical protein